MGEVGNGNGGASRAREPLSDAERARLKALVDAEGELAATAILGIPSQTLARLISGMNVRAGTRALARQGLERLDAEERKKGAARR